MTTRLISVVCVVILMTIAGCKRLDSSVAENSGGFPQSSLRQHWGTAIEDLEPSVRRMIKSPTFKDITKPMLFSYNYKTLRKRQFRVFGITESSQDGGGSSRASFRMQVRETFGEPSNGWVPVTRTCFGTDYVFQPAVPRHVETGLESFFNDSTVAFETDRAGRTRHVLAVSKVKPEFKAMMATLLDEIKRPFVIFPDEPKRPGDRWTATATTTENGLTMTLSGQYTFRGIVESPIVREAALVSSELNLTMTGDVVAPGSKGTQKGTGTGTGNILFDTRNGQEIAGHVVMSLTNVIEGSEYGKHVKITQRMRTEMVVQRE